MKFSGEENENIFHKDFSLFLSFAIFNSSFIDISAFCAYNCIILDTRDLKMMQYADLFGYFLDYQLL